MNKTKKQDFVLMNLLKVNEISRIICETNMGTLKLRIRKGESDYKFVLDSVELPRELHKEIYELLYAPEIPYPDTGSVDLSKIKSIRVPLFSTKTTESKDETIKPKVRRNKKLIK